MSDGRVVGPVLLQARTLSQQSIQMPSNTLKAQKMYLSLAAEHCQRVLTRLLLSMPPVRDCWERMGDAELECI